MYYLNELRNFTLGVGDITLLSLGFVFAFLVSPLGLIFSIIGLSKAKKMGGKQKGLAIAGLIISIISLVVTLIYIIVIAGMVGAASAFDSYY